MGSESFFQVWVEITSIWGYFVDMRIGDMAEKPENRPVWNAEELPD